MAGVANQHPAGGDPPPAAPSCQSVQPGLFWNPSAAGTPGRALIAALIPGCLASCPRSLSRPPGPARLFASGAGGRPETPRLGCRQDPESGFRSGPRARARARVSQGTGHARRGRLWRGAGSGRAAPHFAGGGRRGGVGGREVGAGPVPGIASPPRGAGSGWAARGGSRGRRPGRRLSLGHLLPRVGSRRLRGKPRPRRRIRGKSPSVTRARRGPTVGTRPRF